LVGGHCISRSLLFGTQELGYHPEIILAGRRLNDSREYVPPQIVKLMIKKALEWSYPLDA
jgi:UDP-N-acetyl-D-galactosamine dehydrogenase